MLACLKEEAAPIQTLSSAKTADMNVNTERISPSVTCEGQSRASLTERNCAFPLILVKGTQKAWETFESIPFGCFQKRDLKRRKLLLYLVFIYFF